MASGDHSSNHPPTGATVPTSRRKSLSPGQVLVVTSVMFTFISYWRTAAIVLCDLASTAYYIGGIVESQIGKAAPWFILAVMLFSYAVRSVYIENCSMFVRGGVYRVVREAMGGGLAKLAVSALMFDYILTGPISGVSAGQYIIGLIGDLFHQTFSSEQSELGSAAIAIGITLFFWRVNIRGIHESSDKALKIMGATTLMAVIMIIWCGVTLVMKPELAKLPTAVPDLSRADQPGSPKVDAEGKPIPDAMGNPLDPLGFIGRTSLGDALRPGHIHWLSLFGVLGIFVAFGHSILAMSGEETLAQVYREVESPKLKNFKKAAFVVFVYSMLLTSLISFLAVMIIPDNVRMAKYSGNLIGGLAMNVVGPDWAKLAAQHGGRRRRVPDPLRRGQHGDHRLQRRAQPRGRGRRDARLVPQATPEVRHDLSALEPGRGAAVVHDPGQPGQRAHPGRGVRLRRRLELRLHGAVHAGAPLQGAWPREYKVPLNIRVGRYDVPLGIGLIFLVLFCTAIVNFLTKEVATISGVIFTTAFFVTFTVSERAHVRQTGKAAEHHAHLEQFNQAKADQITPTALGITKPYRKLVAIRSPHNLAMLEKCLSETDPETTDVVVMTANVLPPGSDDMNPGITDEDRALLTAVVNLAEHAGKPVKPLIVPTNEPFYALTRTARTIGAQELIMGMSNKFDPDALLDQVAFYWFHVCEAAPEPLTIRVLGKDRDVRLDIAGGSQIPKLADRAAAAAKLLAELRASWHGVQKLLLAYDGSPLSADFLDTVLSFLDPAIAVTLIEVAEGGESFHADTSNGTEMIMQQGVARAQELGRKVDSLVLCGEAGPQIVKAALEGKYDAIFMSLRGEYRRLDTTVLATTTRYVLQHAPCRVILGFAPKTIAQPEAAAATVPDITTA